MKVVEKSPHEAAPDFTKLVSDKALGLCKFNFLCDTTDTILNSY